MDYEPSIILSREKIRLLSKLFRDLFKIKTILFPVLKVLDKMEMKFSDNLYYSVEEDKCFEFGVMAELVNVEDEEHFCIRIRQSVYDKACNGDHASIGFICHEMCHFFLIFVCGIGPKKYYTSEGLVYAKAIAGKAEPIYNSMEWQAMALCGEVMIPYERYINYSFKQIISRTKSSNEQAKYFITKVVKVDLLSRL